jgi:hypothetical protein
VVYWQLTQQNIKTPHPHLSFFFCLPPDHPQSTKLPQHYVAESDLKEQLKKHPPPKKTTTTTTTTTTTNFVMTDTRRNQREENKHACLLACLLHLLFSSCRSPALRNHP